MTFNVNIDYQTQTSNIVIGSTQQSTYDYSSTLGFRAKISGVMITSLKNPSSILSTYSWIVDSKDALIETAYSSTIVAASAYNLVMTQILNQSIGYYYDKIIGSYVMSCNQSSVMPSLFVYLVNSAGTGKWYEILATDYLNQISNTGFCAVNLLSNGQDYWVLGTDFLNRKAAHFSQSSGNF